MARFVGLIVGITVASLLYVYAEVEAVQIGYRIREQQESKVQALDRLRALKYNTNQLKAPHNLERKLEAQRILLESPKQWQTLIISEGASAKNQTLAHASMSRPPFFSRLFVGTAQAEAKDK